jgi:hypothetical protein
MHSDDSHANPVRDKDNQAADIGAFPVPLGSENVLCG